NSGRADFTAGMNNTTCTSRSGADDSGIGTTCARAGASESSTAPDCTVYTGQLPRAEAVTSVEPPKIDKVAERSSAIAETLAKTPEARRAPKRPAISLPLRSAAMIIGAGLA